MTGHPISKIVIDVSSGGLESLSPRDVIQLCADALREVSNTLEIHIIEKKHVLHNDKSKAKLIKKYIDDAVYWTSVR